MLLWWQADHVVPYTLLRSLTRPCSKAQSGFVSFGRCLQSACLIPFLCLSVFIASCPFIFYSLSQSTFLSSILICCVYVCRNCFGPKTGFAHISSAKSSHPSGTSCSSELCQLSPIHFMNHFLSTFLEHTCAMSAESLSFTINVQIFPCGH